MDERALRRPATAAREARRAWDRAIDAWEDFQETGKDFARDRVHGPALLRMIGPVRGRRVLDVGCGQGRFTRQLARRGARVVGIDWSTRMIELARRHERESRLGIDYRVADARAIGRLRSLGTFDRVVACMSFMDMPDLGRVLRGARCRLRDDGRLVFSVSHPMNTSALGWQNPRGPDRGPMLIGEYFDEQVGVTHWRMARLARPFDTVHWHRTLESWFVMLRHAGFEVVALAEPRSSLAQARQHSVLGGSRRFPFFLVVNCRARPAP